MVRTVLFPVTCESVPGSVDQRSIVRTPSSRDPLTSIKRRRARSAPVARDGYDVLVRPATHLADAIACPDEQAAQDDKRACKSPVDLHQAAACRPPPQCFPSPLDSKLPC